MTKYLFLMQGPGFESRVWSLILLHPWKTRFKSGFHHSFWDLVVPDRISRMTLEIYIYEIWERVLANSFSGIHNSTFICSVGNCVFVILHPCCGLRRGKVEDVGGCVHVPRELRPAGAHATTYPETPYHQTRYQPVMSEHQDSPGRTCNQTRYQL